MSNLSFDKYGKAAFVDLTCTSSKLVDNLLYREVTTLNKIDVGSNKTWELEAKSRYIRNY